MDYAKDNIYVAGGFTGGFFLGIASSWPVTGKALLRVARSQPNVFYIYLYNRNANIIVG
jgi:hypothetical protein